MSPAFSRRMIWRGLAMRTRTMARSSTRSCPIEIFYSIVPDPNGTKSCPHTVDDVGLDVPATFMHELQHLISFAQHFVVHNGDPEYGWLDGGLSIVGEELGSLPYDEQD